MFWFVAKEFEFLLATSNQFVMVHKCSFTGILPVFINMIDIQLYLYDCYCRLPDSADRFFNLSLPYVFWARGDISHATELFCQLSQSEKRCKYLRVKRDTPK